MKHKILLATRHLYRLGDSEKIIQTEISKNYTWKSNIDLIAKDFKIDPIALVSGYKTIGDNFGRTQNTAQIYGYTQFSLEKDLSFSPENWQNIPYGKDFATFVNIYNSGEAGTVLLSDTHADVYKRLVKELSEGNGRHMFTHDSRVESACANLMPNYAEKLGSSLNYGETLVMLVNDSYKFQPLAIVRRGGIQDIL